MVQHSSLNMYNSIIPVQATVDKYTVISAVYSIKDMTRVWCFQGHVIMNPQPQSIYQRVIDRTKSIGFQTQFLAQNVEKMLIANSSSGHATKQVC